ncbi:unnamed protein product [Pieris macdunnoughi]|uniref:Uncharacterized protein n=1 Tax=Pieris macdunnoughi TaxID=345717 RepID=A0A821QJ28_9NEOP|nr:unnamed protein product [Pieris macdunnoughi]
MGTEVPKTHDSSGDSDSNSDSENSSSDTSGSDWECSGSKQVNTRKPHFSVTSCDTGLKLKIAAIPRKVTPKKSAKPTVRKKSNETISKQRQNEKSKKKLSESSSSSESCSKCSSATSSEDDLPLKAVKKSLPSKNSVKVKTSVKSDCEGSEKDIKVKDKLCKSTSTVKKTKCDESSQEGKRQGRQRAKVSTLLFFTILVETSLRCGLSSLLK